MHPSISIVITVYNRSRYLGTAIESVLNQTRRDFELIIWDDASTDDSLDIAYQYAERDKRISVIAAEQNTGFPPAIKAAVAATTGDYIGWIDSDDVLAPTAIEETSLILNNYPQVGLVYTDYELMDSEGNLHGLGPRCQIPYSKEGLLVDLMTFHFRLIRRSVYDAVGGIDDSFASGEDYDLCLKLSEVTEVYHIAKPLYYYRRHSGNVTNDNLKNIYWAQKAINDALIRRGLDEDYELDTHLTAFFSIKPKLKKAGGIVQEGEGESHSDNQFQGNILNSAIPEPVKDEKKSPLVSIIIPCYNPGEMFERCLRSCFEQTYSNIEIIIVDNNSTDGAIAIARQMAATTSYRVIFTKCHAQGQNHAFNHGFTLATGDYIQWLDADDSLMSNKIALQVAALEQNPNFDIAYGDWEYCFYQSDVEKGENPQHIIPQKRCQHRFGFTSRQYDDYLLQTLSHNWQPPLSYLLRRASAAKLQELFAWNPQTFLATDREYYTIAAIIGLQFLYVPNAKVRYNFWSPTQNSRKVSYSWRTECYKKMYLRFQEIASFQPAERITKQHWFLLKQNWDLWKLAPVTLMQKTPDSFFLIDRYTQSGITINIAVARVISALHKINTVCTLEDHAHRIVHLMAQHIVLSHKIDSYDKIVEELSKWVGTEYSSNHDRLTWKQPQLDIKNASSNELRSNDKEQLQALINTIPWFAPIFERQRLAVFYTLDKLRNAGMLVQHTSVQSSLNLLAL
ncbi:MAG: glycosyltransferase [Richelia sp. RM2_1_2]|nr:glycosyltransferase [Richelia sp. SM1_7_0]NJN13366.1 glycosyltransferase [Richelia sp. RM1_1_1]NJO30061.1 glycosyltransferase [Richelia sp. SL_2_1]NJO65057.1 glycosyltransferase [Richelia sp. RM2_1_2]